MELSLLQWFFQGIPECLALAAFAIVIAGRKLETRNVFFIGLSQAVAAYLVRLLPLSFGVHIIMLIVVLAILLNVWLKVSLSRGLFTALVVLIILAAAETAFVSIMYLLIGIPFEKVRQDLLLWIIHGWPHIIFLILLALAVEKWRKRRQTRREKLDA